MISVLVIGLFGRTLGPLARIGNPASELSAFDRSVIEIPAFWSVTADRGADRQFWDDLDQQSRLDDGKALRLPKISI